MTRHAAIAALGVALAAALCLAAPRAAAAAAGEEKPAAATGPFDHRPAVYWGIGAGVSVTRFKDAGDLCRLAGDGELEDCIHFPVGGGLAIFGGIRPHRHLAVDLSWDFFLHGRSEAYTKATLQSLRVDARAFLVAGRRLEPYVQVGGGLYWFGDEYSWERAGGGFQAGAGIDVLLTPGFSMGLQALYRGVYFGARKEAGVDVYRSVYTSNFEATLRFSFRYPLQ